MASRDLRVWIDQLEAEGELKRISAKVDWDEEIAHVVRKVFMQRGPALLFENIKDHENTRSTKLFTSGLGKRSRMALMLGLPKDTPTEELIQVARKRLKEPLEPVRVKAGPVKENIVKGEDVDLFQFPVPKWHPLDLGRYINTFCGTVTKDPDTGEHNVGIYRGTILSRNRIGVMLVPAQHWGITYKKYQEMGKAMPVAVVYGWDPSLLFVAGAPVKGCEYDLAGAMRQEPTELVKCETSDLEVPAFAEIVVEGTISPDPSTYEVEGPFGEWTGFYGEARRRPVLEVSCISHRNDPIFRGGLEGMKAGVVNESAVMTSIAFSAIAWNVLDSQEIPGVLDLTIGPITVVKIHKTYQGQARQIAAALWGSRLTVNILKLIMVVEEDVDIHNLRALQLAFRDKVDPTRDLVVFPEYMGSTLDPAMPSDMKDELKYGIGVQNKLLIDATTDWETHPIRAEWGDRRYPPTCTEPSPEIEELVERRWKEYGF